jgi:hypothetical protein
LAPWRAGAAFICEFGMWMHFVDVADKAAVLDDRRMWHAHWHDESTHLVHLANEGGKNEVTQTLRPQRGHWGYAVRRVNQLLQLLWSDPQSVPPFQMRQGSSRAQPWEDVVVMREASEGDGHLCSTVVLEASLPVGASVEPRNLAKPDAGTRRLQVQSCHPWQRVAQDVGLWVAYLGM